jgi:hypothetical protein
LYKAQIKYLKEEGAWPPEFGDDNSLPTGEVERTAEKLTNVKLAAESDEGKEEEDADDEQDDNEEEDSGDSDDEEIFKNTNR